MGLLPDPGAARRPRPVGALLWPTGLHHDPWPPAWPCKPGATVVLARCERLSWGRGFDLCFTKTCPAPCPPRWTQPYCNDQAAGHLIRQRPQYLWGWPTNNHKRPLPPPERRMNTSRLGLALDATCWPNCRCPLTGGGIGWGLAQPAVYPGRPRRKIALRNPGLCFPEVPLPSAAPGPKKRSWCFAKPVIDRSWLWFGSEAFGTRPRATDRCPARGWRRHRHHRLCAALFTAWTQAACAPPL